MTDWPLGTPFKFGQPDTDIVSSLVEEATNETEKQMTEQAILDEIRKGVKQEMESALVNDVNPLLMHAITHSYLLLQILDMLDAVNTNIVDVGDEVSKLNPIYK